MEMREGDARRLDSGVHALKSVLYAIGSGIAREDKLLGTRPDVGRSSINHSREGRTKVALIDFLQEKQTKEIG